MFKGLKGLIARLLLCACFSVAGSAVRGQELTGLLLEFGSLRGALFGLLQERPAGTARLAFTLADLTGLNPDRLAYPYIAHKSWSISPALRYESNINGGINADTIYVYGLPFAVDEKSKAISDTTGGIAMSSSLHIAAAHGVILTMAAKGEYRHALKKNFSVRSASFNIGLSKNFENMRYIQALAYVGGRWTDFQHGKNYSAALTYGRLTGSARQLQDMSLTVARVFNNKVWQNRLRANWSLGLPAAGYFTLSLEKGERIAGEMLFDYAIGLSWSDFLFGRATSFSLSHREEKGIRIAGTEREDRVWSLRAERRISANLNGYIAVEKRDSTVDAFSDTLLDLGIVIRSLRF